MPHHKVQNVFIAAPGDLLPERKAFPRIIEQVNDLKANSLGIHLKAVGWEDTLPSFGRPQALINKDVVSSDVFVMLLWKRWGTPSGEFSSGTEEEFVIAQNRYKQTGHRHPHLLMYFRSPPESMMADPGEQLRKVLDFRSRIEADRVCLYNGYDELEQWEDLFRKHLCRWLDQQKYGPDFGVAEAKNELELLEDSEKRIQLLQEQLHLIKQELETTQSKLRSEAVDKAADAVKLVDQGQLTLAEEMFAKSLDLYEEPEVLNTFGRFLFQIGSVDRALTKYHRVLTLGDEYNKPSLRALAMSSLGVVYREQGQWDEAEVMHKQALQINLELEDDKATAIEYKNLGSVFRVRGDISKAEAMYRAALQLNETLGNREGLAVDYAHIGSIRRIKGDLKGALTMYEQALGINKKINNRAALASNYSNMSSVYRKLAVPPRDQRRLYPGARRANERAMLAIAEDMCNESLRLNSELGTKIGMANNYANLGSILMLKRRFPQAKEMFTNALAINLELGDKEGLAKDYIDLGRVYNSLGRWGDAITMFDNSLEINSELNSKHIFAVSYKHLGTTYRKMGRDKDAKKMWLNAIRYFDLLDNRREVQRLRKLVKAI